MPFDDDVRDVAPAGDYVARLAGFMHLIVQLGAEERAVLQLVAERLHTGQQRCGQFDLATDGRDWHRETLEEIADALVYAACGLMRRRE